MTFWPLTNSDFPTDQTFHQFHDLYTELDLHRIMSGFHGAFAMGVDSQQGTLTLPDTWFRPPFWDLLMLQLLRPNSSNLPCLYSTFHLEYSMVLSRFCFIFYAIWWLKEPRKVLVVNSLKMYHKSLSNAVTLYRYTSYCSQNLTLKLLNFTLIAHFCLWTIFISSFLFSKKNNSTCSWLFCRRYLNGGDLGFHRTDDTQV